MALVVVRVFDFYIDWWYCDKILHPNCARILCVFAQINLHWPNIVRRPISNYNALVRHFQDLHLSHFLATGCDRLKRTSFPVLVAQLFTIGNRSSTMVPPVVTLPTGDHQKTIIFLHGLGDTGHSWGQSISSVRPKTWKVIAPTANSRPVTLNRGCYMHSWFDILGLSESCDEDVSGIHEASVLVKQMIDKEIESTGISSENIILGGFSQGGALALYTALTSDKKLGGVIALSTWLPLRSEFPEKLSEVNKSIKIFQAHGHIDPVVALRWGETTKIFLQSLGVSNYTFKKYPDMMHGTCDQEMVDVQSFLDDL